MTLIVDARHWLEDGDLPIKDLRLRRRMLRVARMIEYGAALRAGQSRDTLIECTRRPARDTCLGLMRVTKLPDDRIGAICTGCGHEECVIAGWRDTPWATGPSRPIDWMPAIEGGRR